VETLERVAIIRDLRRGEFDVLVGINLLREGLDLPEVSLVAILDADKEGFLRAERSLIQTIGRASRNLHGRVFMYADRITASMAVAIRETERRRTVQAQHNQAHGITPQTVKRAILDLAGAEYPDGTRDEASRAAEAAAQYRVKAEELPEVIAKLRREMQEAAKALEFERAAELRDQIRKLQEIDLRVR
jgi:excinuclease ABC subunit B